jgi:hypothetical protein
VIITKIIVSPTGCAVEVAGNHIGTRPTYRAAAALAAREVRRLGGLTQKEEKEYWKREAERIVAEQMRMK